MTDPSNISINDYSYALPEERIARYPLAERDASTLLIYKEGEITEDIYRNISRHIPENSLFIFNNTKVVEARLLFQKPTGGVIEIFCLEPDEQYPDITTAMLQQEKVQWHCLIGGASKWKAGQQLQKKIAQDNKEVVLTASYVGKKKDSFIIGLSWAPVTLSFAEVLHCAGAIPLPPYIKREAEKADAERYQTVYAHHDGSVAAPTAGLHFTELIFDQLKQKNIQKDFVTLHVGAGTFKPVKTNTMKEHEMHAEYIDVTKAFIENIIDNLENNNNIIAVGTTSLRTIESLYWIGVKHYKIYTAEFRIDPNSSFELTQWEVYELSKEKISVRDALKSLLDWMDKKGLKRLVTKTQILIAPGYQFKIANGLITNFHQPQSTLLLLVAAFIGDDWRKVYDQALQNGYRFLSYGDGSLLWRSPASPVS